MFNLNLTVRKQTTPRLEHSAVRQDSWPEFFKTVNIMKDKKKKKKQRDSSRLRGFRDMRTKCNA